MPISEYFPDDEIISELRMFFDNEEDIDFSQVLSQVEVVDDDTFEVRIRDRVFRFDRVFCSVEEVSV